MDAYEYSELLKKLSIKIENIRNIVEPSEKNERLNIINELQLNPDFWNDAKSASVVSQEKTIIERISQKYNLKLNYDKCKHRGMNGKAFIYFSDDKQWKRYRTLHT